MRTSSTATPGVFGPSRGRLDAFPRRAARARGSAWKRRPGKFPRTPHIARAISSRRIQKPYVPAEVQPLSVHPKRAPKRAPSATWSWPPDARAAQACRAGVAAMRLRGNNHSPPTSSCFPAACFRTMPHQPTPSHGPELRAPVSRIHRFNSFLSGPVGQISVASGDVSKRTAPSPGAQYRGLHAN